MAELGKEGVDRFLDETPAVTDVARGMAYALILAAKSAAEKAASGDEVLESPLKDGPPVGSIIGL